MKPKHNQIHNNGQHITTGGEPH